MTSQPVENTPSGPIDLRDVLVDGCVVPGCTRRRHNGRLCSAHESRLRDHGDVRADDPIRDQPQPDRRPLADRFWSKVDRSESGTTCWLWTGSRMSPSGRGTMSIDNRTVPAARVGWELAYGPIPDGLWVLHRCDVPACVRPDHLFLGDALANVRDMDAKGRRRYVVHHGSAHPQSKLTEPDVVAIRAEYARGGVTMPDLGRRYGVDDTTIWDIVHRRAWAHVP